MCEWPGDSHGPIYAGTHFGGYPWLSYHRLPRATSRRAYEEFINLLGALALLLNKANITYIMADGTLLGSFVAHDMIPWDDDADVMIKLDDVPKVQRLFQDGALRGRLHVNVMSYKDDIDLYSVTSMRGSRRTRNQTTLIKEWTTIKEHLNRGDTDFHNIKYKLKFKLYSSTMKKGTTEIYGHPWKWPFVDVKYYLENETTVWNLDTKSETIYWNKSDMYPLYDRPFGRLRLPAPHDTGAILRAKYKNFACKSSAYNHKFEHLMPERKTQICSVLTKTYPFVFREKFSTFIVEKKTLGGKVYKHFCVPVIANTTLSFPSWLI